MKFRMQYVSRTESQARTLTGWDRGEIESKFRRLEADIASAEVLDEHGTVVARKEADRDGLFGLPAKLGWGYVCPDCWTLSGHDRHASPHENLSKLSTARYRGGMADGTIVNYQCSVCGTQLQCDNDRKDLDAGWSVHRWPTSVPYNWGVQI